MSWGKTSRVVFNAKGRKGGSAKNAKGVELTSRPLRVLLFFPLR